MTSTEYIEKKIKPKVGGVIWSPHSIIFKRGYPLTHKILAVKKQKREDGEYHFLVTVQSKTPTKKIFAESRTMWLEEID